MDSLLVAAALWLAAINLAAWLAFAIDKRAAGRKARRVPERTLLTLALLGGSPAAIAARQALRHKTRKEPFGTILLGIVLAQAIAIGAVAWWMWGGGAAPSP